MYDNAGVAVIELDAAVLTMSVITDLKFIHEGPEVLAGEFIDKLKALAEEVHRDSIKEAKEVVNVPVISKFLGQVENTRNSCYIVLLLGIEDVHESFAFVRLLIEVPNFLIHIGFV